jgi:hypothetical protein
VSTKSEKYCREGQFLAVYIILRFHLHLSVSASTTIIHYKSSNVFVKFVKAVTIFQKMNRFYKFMYTCLCTYNIKYDSAIDIATVYGLDKRGTGDRFPVG